MIVRALAAAVEGTDVFPAVASVQTSDPPPGPADVARAHDIPLLRGSGNAMRALANVARWRPVVRGAPSDGDAEPVDLSDLLADGALAEFESALVVERYGVAVAPRRRAATPGDAAAAAADLGFPVVVKVDGPAHKQAAGGVVLGLQDEETVAAAAERLGGRVLVARQTEAGFEAFCGVTRDELYGPVLAVGPGGRNVETLSVAAVTLAPVRLEEAYALVGRAPAVADAAEPAREALARTLVALGRLAGEHPEVAAVDVNPLILGEDGAVAVDALVVVDRGGSG
jgi:acetyltransferase